MLRGAGRFVDDLRVPGMLRAVFVRSPHAKAKILAIETADARAAQGVVAVFVGKDFADLKMPAVNRLVEGLSVPSRRPMAIEHIDHPGQPVALVVARDLASARRAAALVAIEAEAFDAIRDPGCNELNESPSSDAADSARNAGGFVIEHGAPLAADPLASLSVECRHQQPRVAAVALEPRAVLACVELSAGDSGSKLSVWLQSQSPSRSRIDIAESLGIEIERVRVIAPDVGGAFGSKASIFPDDLLVCSAALHLGRPVKWTATRSEEFVAGVHGRGSTLEGRLALDAEGHFRSLEASLVFPLGGWLPFSATVPARNAARILPGPYRVPAVHVRARATGASAAGVNIYRGAGRPEAAILMESLVEQAARRSGIDPVELRRRNLLRATELPFTTASGETLDSGDYLRTLDQACEEFGYDEARRSQRVRQAAGERVGIGVAFYVEPCGQGWESATVHAHVDGRFVVASGSSAQGQGHETVFAAVAAAALGCEASAIEVLQGDTSICPPGIGALASRSIAIGASAIDVACRQMATRIAARIAAGERPLPRSGLTESIVYEPRGEAWSHGCVIAQLRIDAATGHPCIETLVWADDAGRIVDPMLAHGQLVGGLAQGLGQALLERIVYDENGQLLTGSLMDYALPRASDMPPVSIRSHESPSPMNVLGAKGVGEAGCIGVPAAILNAANDALACGQARTAPDLQFPLTPERLWRAMTGA